MSLTWSSVVWLKKRIPNARFHRMAGNERSNADSRWNDIVGFDISPMFLLCGIEIDPASHIFFDCQFLMQYE